MLNNAEKEFEKPNIDSDHWKLSMGIPCEWGVNEVTNYCSEQND